MIAHPPLWVSETDARLGDAIVALEQRREERTVPIPLAGQIPDEVLLLIYARLDLLEQQVAQLQQQTPLAYWYRVLNWCALTWRRLWQKVHRG